jgi:hypothetical protein
VDTHTIRMERGEMDPEEKFGIGRHVSNDNSPAERVEEEPKTTV